MISDTINIYLPWYLHTGLAENMAGTLTTSSVTYYKDTNCIAGHFCGVLIFAICYDRKTAILNYMNMDFKLYLTSNQLESNTDGKIRNICHPDEKFIHDTILMFNLTDKNVICNPVILSLVSYFKHGRSDIFSDQSTL